MPTLPSSPNPATATAHRVAEGLTWAAALGAALLALGHSGLQVPLLSAIGPGGDRAVPVAAAIFAVGTAVFLVVGWGLRGGARWARPAALAVHGLTALSLLRPYRGVASAVGLMICLGAVAALVAATRRARVA